MNDRVDWVAEYKRLCQIFREHWDTDGMHQIVKAISEVVFRGVDVNTALQDAVVREDALAVAERNMRATAGFGAAIPANLCKCLLHLVSAYLTGILLSAAATAGLIFSRPSLLTCCRACC